MEEIIKKAIEGGWKYHGDIPVFDKTIGQWMIADGDGGYLITGEKDFTLDPLFWQALGRACGWEGELTNSREDWNTKEKWLYHALHFHEINLTEGWDKAVEYLTEVTRHPK